MSQLTKPLHVVPLKDKNIARAKAPKNILASKNYYVLWVT